MKGRTANCLGKYTVSCSPRFLHYQRKKNKKQTADSDFFFFSPHCGALLLIRNMSLSVLASAIPPISPLAVAPPQKLCHCLLTAEVSL